MNRFVFGRGWVYAGPTDGTGADAGGGAAAGTDAGAQAGDGAGDDAGDGEGDDAALGDTGDEGAAAGAGADGKRAKPPADMKSAIDAALGYTKKPGDAAAPKKDEKKPEAAAAGKDTETHHANGKPKKSDKGEDLDAEGKVVAKGPAKAKTAAELDLNPEEKKGLHAKTQARFAEVITTLKERETTIAALTETNKTLAQARDEILGVMQETKTSPDQLTAYLEFNSMLQSGDPKQLQQALGMVEKQRLALYTALGKEPAEGGIDLLKDFPDLQQKVTDATITREDALEIAQGRRDKAAREDASRRQQDQQRTQTQTAAQRQQATDAAEAEILKWTTSLAKTDLDYNAKEDKLLAKLDGVVKNYPPNLWLSTLKMMYESIEVQKAPASSGRTNQPLRPSGAKPGDKKPGDMLEAINQGLGYAAGKG